MRKKMDLPRNHFSWSQLSLWESSPKAYVDRYIHNKPMFETKALLYGKKFADDMEALESDDPVIENMIQKVPRGVVREFEIRADFEGIELIGYEDADAIGGFIEYKTGPKPWDQDRADNHGQLHFYALIRKLIGISCTNAELVWLPTDGTKFTGEVKIFEVSITEKQIENIKKRISKAIKEIKEYKIKGSITI